MKCEMCKAVQEYKDTDYLNLETMNCLPDCLECSRIPSDHLLGHPHRCVGIGVSPMTDYSMPIEQSVL